MMVPSYVLVVAPINPAVTAINGAFEMVSAVALPPACAKVIV